MPSPSPVSCWPPCSSSASAASSAPWRKSAPGRFFGTWWYHAWGFDWLYDKLFVKPYLLLCQLLGRDPIDRTLGVVPFSVRGGHNLLSLTENGRLRWYAASLVGGAAILLGALLLA